MKVLFAHDHKFHLINNDFYSNGLTDETWERYTKVFDEIHVVARVVEDDVSKKLRKITCPQVKIHQSRQLYFSDIAMEKIIMECDVVIARLHSFIGNRAVKYAIKHNKPYLIELVACPWEAYWNHGLLGKMIAPYMEMHTKKLVKNSPYVIYVTEQYLQKRYPTNGLNTNCSNVSLLEFDEMALENRMEFIKKRTDKIILGTTAAVNVKFKGQQFVIEALSRLKKQGVTKYEYQLVGGGDNTYLKSIAEKYDVAEQVKFLGSLSHDKVFDWLDTIDLYVQPSRQEGLPRALIEAMSRGLPAFGARTAGIPELLDSKFIFSNTNRNITEICDILKRFNKETMLFQAKRNYKESKKYSKETIEKRRLKFFEEIARSVKG